MEDLEGIAVALVVISLVAKDLVVDPVDLVLGNLENHRCSVLYVPSVENLARFLFVQMVKSQCIVISALVRTRLV